MKKLKITIKEVMYHLINKKSINPTTAEAMVLQTLKESEVYLKQGMFSAVCEALKMVHIN